MSTDTRTATPHTRGSTRRGDRPMPVPRDPHPLVALLPLLALIALASASTLSWKIGMILPIVAGIVVAAVIGRLTGHSWKDMEAAMTDGVSRAMPAVFILLIIGMIIGTWISGGVIPTLIHYGLEFINPTFFLPMACLVTAFISLVLGSSFTSIATVGLAFMAIGGGMGVPLPIVAGAVISGAFFGDKLSPLSDTTNVAPAMVGEGLFDHIRHMLWDTIPGLVLSAGLFWFIGLRVSPGGDVDTAARDTIQAGLSGQFTIHPALLLVVLATLVIIALRVPAIPALVLVAALGGLSGVLVQGRPVGAVLKDATTGYTSTTGQESVDSLLTNGGVASMFMTIGLVIVATALGGLLERTGVFRALIDPLVRRIRRKGSLIAATVMASFLVGFSTGAQFLAVILPARGMVDAYRRMGLSPLNLSRAVEAAGTVGINLVPWGVPAVFAAGVFGLEPMEFIPWILFAFIVPALNVLYGYTGLSIKRIAPAEVDPEDPRD